MSSPGRNHAPHRNRRRLAIAAGWLLLAAHSPAAAQGWLVLPFANQSGETSLDWLGQGLAISLEEMLRGAGQTTVAQDAARGIASEWKVPAGRALTIASALKAADHSGAERVVIGLFRLVEGELRVEAQVLDAVEPALRGDVSDRARLGDLFDLQRRLSRALLRLGEEGLAFQAAVRDATQAPPLSAYEQYVKALLLPRNDKRLQALRQAARSFPNFPLLQFRLAEELHEAGKDDEALGSLERIADLRFSLSPEARLLRAEILLERGDAPAAAAAAGSAMDLRDSYRARLLRAEANVARGAVEEARADLDRARELGAPGEEIEALARRLSPPAP